MKHANVLEMVYEPRRLQQAWRQVRRHADSVGIDQLTADEFEGRAAELLGLMHSKIKSGNYRFRSAHSVPVVQKKAAKTQEVRIPAVMDQIVTQCINSVFDELFDLSFIGPHTGLCPCRSRLAINRVQAIVIKRNEWSAAIDLQRLFDEIPHNLILKLIRRRIADEFFVTLVARALMSGVIVDRKVKMENKGCPQGAPVSPMVMNLVLNELNDELQKKGLQCSRWTNDFVVLLQSEQTATRVMAGTIRYLASDPVLSVDP